MRQTLLVMACLATFALAQNVLAIAPAASVSAEASLAPVSAPAGVGFVASRSSLGEEAPALGSTALLCAGLAGLTVAGGRRHDRERVPA